MNNIKIFRVFGILTLISLYFLILAGGIVRATGSGMGCPDWPKCFGYYLPPSDISQVIFKPNHNYQKKVFVIHEHKLFYAKAPFKSGNAFNEQDWVHFKDHGYTEFNPTHTWIEAMNRYIGVFVGLFVLGLFVYSYVLYKKYGTRDQLYDYTSILKYSFVALVFVVIQAIIGKYLVASNLKIKMLTIHMLFTYTVLFTVIYVLYNTSKNIYQVIYDKKIFNILKVAILLTAIQTALGTQVTANVETLLKEGTARMHLVENFNFWFYIHRSFSILLVATNILLCYKIYQRDQDKSIRLLALLCIFAIGLEVMFGVSLNYFGYPTFAQPLHLLFGTLIAGIQFYLFVIYHKEKQVKITV